MKFVEKVVLDSNYFYHYTINNSSATNRYKNNSCKEYKKILIKLEKYLKNKFEKDSYLKRLYKLKMKYFFICIGNELHPLNNKTILQNKKYIKSICEDYIIVLTMKNYKVGLSKKIIYY